MQSSALRVTVLDNGQEVEHTVRVINPDRLRAEQMAVRLKLPGLKDASLTHTTLWAWAALKRTGQFDTDAHAFLNDLCIDVSPDREESGAVDPTDPSPHIDSP